MVSTLHCRQRGAPWNLSGRRGPARTSPQMPTSCPGGMTTRRACSVGPLRARCRLRRDPVELAMLLREAAGSLKQCRAHG